MNIMPIIIAETLSVDGWIQQPTIRHTCVKIINVLSFFIELLVLKNPGYI